jgi:hypothetical protein
MMKPDSEVSFRVRFEKAFAAVASAAIVAFVAIGTFSMCGVGRVIA